MAEIKVGIIGASGFVGAELVKILLTHSDVTIAGISSANHKGESFPTLYPSFTGQFEQTFEDNETVIARSDAVFLCLPHGKSEALVKQSIDAGKKVIDIGADFRLKDLKAYEEWYDTKVQHPSLHEQAVYGLTEWNREKIATTSLVANPGCYSTSILLGLYPAVSEGLVDPSNMIIDSKSGVTGAGKGLSETLHFANKNEGLRAYKVANHRHTPEIEEKLVEFGGPSSKVSFVPHLLPVNRGILSTIYVKVHEGVSEADVRSAYEKYYKNESFVQVLEVDKWPDINHVKHSNICQIGLKVDQRTNHLIITSVLDNMQKGAAGQAVQNFNVMMGLEETKGLTMVAPSF